MRGALFEDWVVVALLKGRLHRARRPSLFLWRNNAGLQIDVVAESAAGLRPIEVKSGTTIADDWLASLRTWVELAGGEARTPTIVFGGQG